MESRKQSDKGVHLSFVCQIAVSFQPLALHAAIISPRRRQTFDYFLLFWQRDVENQNYLRDWNPV